MAGLSKWRPTRSLVGASEPHRQEHGRNPLLVAPEESAPGTTRAPRPMADPSTIVVEIGRRIDRADIPPLCARVRLALDASDAELVVCDVAALTKPDCVAVDALARVQLTVMRAGRRLRLRGVSPELRSLLCFVGLSDLGTA
jgi:anti-anti-sigma regulatory factor